MVVTQKLHAHLLIYPSSGPQSSKVIYDMAGVTENPIRAYTTPGVFFFLDALFFFWHSTFMHRIYPHAHAPYSSRDIMSRWQVRK